MTDYPYMLSNNKIAPIISKIQQAARPPKFTIEVLRSLGFTSTNICLQCYLQELER